jgi:hypothetical protein
MKQIHLLWTCVYDMGHMLIERSVAYSPWYPRRLYCLGYLCARRLQRRGPLLDGAVIKSEDNLTRRRSVEGV